MTVVGGTGGCRHEIGAAQRSLLALAAASGSWPVARRPAPAHGPQSAARRTPPSLRPPSALAPPCSLQPAALPLSELQLVSARSALSLSPLPPYLLWPLSLRSAPLAAPTPLSTFASIALCSALVDRPTLRTLAQPWPGRLPLWRSLCIHATPVCQSLCQLCCSRYNSRWYARSSIPVAGRRSPVAADTEAQTTNRRTTDGGTGVRRKDGRGRGRVRVRAPVSSQHAPAA